MTEPVAPLAPKSSSKTKLPSPIWLVPIFAAILAGAVAYNSITQRGPLVEIRFSAASGVQAEKTFVKHKDVVVGEVEKVELSDDLEHVVVHARLDKSMAPYVGDTTQFWIVSARVSRAQVSGLDTLLSGAYIEMDWTEVPTRKVREIEGLEAPPLTELGTPGRRVTLVSDRGGALNVGSTLYYRQLPAGRVESRELSEDGRRVTFTAFIDAPYDRFVNSETRFWNVSGLEIEAGASGLSVNVESLAALLSGGAAFGAFEDRLGGPLGEEASFTLFPSRRDAEESLFSSEGQVAFQYVVEFTEAIGGLKPGAPVQYEGITVGRVVDVVVDVDPTVIGPPRIYAIVRLEPSRLTKDEIIPAEFLETMDALVSVGLRMQLTVGNILSGSLALQMAILPDAEPATIDYDAEPYPMFPTAPSEITAIARNVEEVIASLASLPLEDLVLAATSLLQETEALVSSPSVAALPSDVAELARVLTVLSQEAEGTLQGLNPDSPLYIELTAATAELRLAAASIARLAERLEEQPNSLITGRN